MHYDTIESTHKRMLLFYNSCYNVSFVLQIYMFPLYFDNNINYNNNNNNNNNNNTYRICDLHIMYYDFTAMSCGGV